MQIKFIGTGSAGNCIAIQSDSTTILIDIGIPKTKVEKALIEQDINPADINAIFLTHAHGDHIKGLPMAKKWNIPIYASVGTWKSIPNHETLYDGVDYEQPCTFDLGNDFNVTSFRTHHDDFDSYGYVIEFMSYGNRKKISVCLDTGHIDNEMIEAMSGSDVYIIEANHDEETLINNTDRPDSVKARILSDVGHLSNVQTAEALGKLVQGNWEKIYLAHLSGSNNNPALAMAEVVRVLKKKGFKMNVDYSIGCV